MRFSTLRWVLLAGSFPFFLLLVAEAGLRWRNEPILRRPQCARPDPAEIHTLAPGCRAWEDSPAGPYEFRVNEDGFRERPRAELAKGAVFLLGDSHAEGFRLPEEQGLARRLEEALGRPVLNTGLQGTGPGQELLRARRALRNYTPLGALWLLNSNDALDEIFFRAVTGGEPNPLGRPELLEHPFNRLNVLLGGKSRLAQKLVEIYLFQGPYVRFMKGRRFDPALHCRALEEGAAEFRARNVPLVFVAFGDGPEGAHLKYRGLEVEPADYESLLGCARRTGLPLIDLRGAFPEPSLYWPADWHFNPAGTVKLAAELARRAAPFLEKKPERPRP